MNEAYETCKRCNKVAGCFFLIISSVDRDMITKTVTFSIVGGFGFSMSPRDVYYQLYKNAPILEGFCQHKIYIKMPFEVRIGTI